MTDACVNLIYGMILNAMSGNSEAVWELYEQYKRETRLHVTVKEYIEWRKEMTA